MFLGRKNVSEEKLMFSREEMIWIINISIIGSSFSIQRSELNHKSWILRIRYFAKIHASAFKPAGILESRCISFAFEPRGRRSCRLGQRLPKRPEIDLVIGEPISGNMAVPIRTPYFRLVQGAMSPSFCLLLHLLHLPLLFSSTFFIPSLSFLSFLFNSSLHLIFSFSPPFARSMREDSMHTICFHQVLPHQAATSRETICSNSRYLSTTYIYLYVHWLFLASRDANQLILF